MGGFIAFCHNDKRSCFLLSVHLFVFFKFHTRFEREDSLSRPFVAELSLEAFWHLGGFLIALPPYKGCGLFLAAIKVFLSNLFE